jgi:phosphoserine phosphatase RsbU/P
VSNRAGQFLAAIDMVFDPKTEFNNLGQRLGELAGRFEKTARKRGADKAAAKGVKVVETVVNSIHDMFTHGVTKEEFSTLIHREARDTLRFYTREIDFESLRPLPWFKRYPLTAWKVFVATAYRLSPPRRIAFAIAIFTFLLGALHLLAGLSQPPEAVSVWFWWLIAFALVLLLLLMELRDKLDLKRDLEIAREIQIALVPSGPYERDSIKIFSHMRPANTVGGDYHDIIELGGNRLGILIGDVAGKGIPAALLMALLQGSLRTLLTAGFRGPELIQKLNVYLYENIPNDRLVTLFYGELDTVSGALTYVNAGHNAPFLLRRGRPARRLDTTSMVLGVLEDTVFESREAQLESGDRLLLFTDGISEAFNQNDQEFGEERLEAFLRNQAALNEEELIFGLIKDVLVFCDPARPTDDVTLMCISRL